MTTDLIALSLADAERVWDYQSSDIDWQAVSNIARKRTYVCNIYICIIVVCPMLSWLQFRHAGHVLD